MAELKPVPGQILLTDAEFSEAITGAVKNLLHVVGQDDDGRRRNGEHIVRSVMQALNELRLGPPAGELRRSPAGSLAVRTQTERGTLAWEVVYLAPEDGTNPRVIGADTIQRWRVNHSESWNGRLTESDYADAPTERETD